MLSFGIAYFAYTMEKLSVVIITFNEQHNIRRCLDSVQKVADEIVILDSCSTDQTETICRSYPKVKFYVQPFAGHVRQKNDAAALASFDLVLSLDADEQLSDLLATSISEVKNNRSFDGYSMNRLTSYCGKWIYHSGWYPDRKIRLFDRRKGSWRGVDPHDKYEVEKGATVFHLQGDLLHFSYNKPQELILQTNKFAKIGAHALFNSGRKGKWTKMFYSPLFRFFRAYILKMGFLDGRAGLVIAWYSAKECFLKYNMLRKLVFSSKA